MTAARPDPPVDPATGRWQAPLATIFSLSPERRGGRLTDERDRLVLADADLARRYTCAHCNRAWCVGDPAFDYYRFGPQGSPTEGKVVETLGRFARCVDRDACAHRRANLHADQHPDQLTLADERPAVAGLIAAV